MAGPHLYTVDRIGLVDQYNKNILYFVWLANGSPIFGESLTGLPQTTAFPGFDALNTPTILYLYSV